MEQTMEVAQTTTFASECASEATTALALAGPQQELCNLAQLPPFSPDQAVEMVKIRKDLPLDVLAVFTRNLIGHYGKGLYKISRPFLQDVKRNFDNLDRKKQVDGSYREYDGARSFNDWLEKHKDQIGSKRNAYYILDGGVPDNGKLSRAPWSTKTADGTTVLDAFSTIQKDIRRSEKPGDYFEREAIYFTKQLYFIHWPIWKRLLIVASEDIGLADLSVSREVAHLWEVAKMVKDAKHSDLLMLIEAVAICCRAKKSRAIDNAIHYDKTWTPMTDEQAEKLVSETTAYTVPDYADDGLHTASNGGDHEKFVVNEDAALGNRSEIGEIVSAEYKRGYDEGFAAGVASVMLPTKSKPSKKTRESKRSKSAAGQVHIDERPRKHVQK